MRTGPPQGAAGSVYVNLVFTNLDHTHACTLYGYPGVSFGGGTPVTQIGQASTENPAIPRRWVTLPGGGTAHALLRIVDAGNYPASQCKPKNAPYLQVIPPGQTVPVYVAHNGQACASSSVRLLSVGAVRPGTGS